MLIKAGLIISEKELNKLGISLVIERKINSHNRLKSILKSRQISIYLLSKAVGISRQGMSLIVNQKIDPTVSICIKISECLNLKVEDIFYVKTSDWGKLVTEDSTDKALSFDILNNLVVYDQDIKNKDEYIDIETNEVHQLNSPSLISNDNKQYKKRYFKLIRKITPQQLI